MFSHRIHEEASFRTYFDWLLLGFLAGIVNAGGYLGCHRFVSHVTGFATLAGIGFSEQNWAEAIGSLSIPLFFLVGAMISAFLTEKKQAANVHGQKFTPVMGAVGILLFIAGIGGHLGWFGRFGDPANISQDYLLLAMLCGACGLQNAAITSASGATIRTTHLTGLTTDLGLGIIRSEVHHLSQEQQRIERKANILRALTIGVFACGSLVGALLFVRLQYLGFLFPAVLAFYAAWAARRYA